MSTRTTTSLLTPDRAALLDRIETAPKRKRCRDAPARPSIDSAAALLESDLKGEDLEDAFAALTLAEQTLYVDDPRHLLRKPVEIYLV